MSCALTRGGRATSLVGWIIVHQGLACAVSTRRLIAAAELRLLLDAARVQA